MEKFENFYRFCTSSTVPNHPPLLQPHLHFATNTNLDGKNLLGQDLCNNDAITKNIFRCTTLLFDKYCAMFCNELPSHRNKRIFLMLSTPRKLFKEARTVLSRLFIRIVVHSFVVPKSWKTLYDMEEDQAEMAGLKPSHETNKQDFSNELFQLTIHKRAKRKPNREKKIKGRSNETVLKDKLGESILLALYDKSSLQTSLFECAEESDCIEEQYQKILLDSFDVEQAFDVLDNYDFEVDTTVYDYPRGGRKTIYDRDYRRAQRHQQRTFAKIDGQKLKIDLNPKCKRFIRYHTLAKCRRKREILDFFISNQVENIEKKLRTAGLQRRSTLSDPNATVKRSRKAGNTWVSVDHHFVVNSTNSCLENKQTTSTVVSLQYRDLTPEDYELLLALDDVVPKKTISTEKLGQIERKSVPVHMQEEGYLCCICLDALGEFMKQLPTCEHCFHVHCIDAWLSNQADVCPIDQQKIVV